MAGLFNNLRAMAVTAKAGKSIFDKYFPATSKKVEDTVNKKKEAWKQNYLSVPTQNATGNQRTTPQATQRNGLSPIRPYLTTMAQKYRGITEDDINKNLVYDNKTGEVFFYGKNIGTPETLENGVSYWDTAKLDAIAQDTAKRLGLEQNPNVKYDQWTDNVQQNFNKNDKFIADGYAYTTGEMAKNKGYVNQDKSDYKAFVNRYLKMAETNPFVGGEARAIYDIYGLKGENAAGDAIASGAASNSGNVDSFAQANANRQRLAYKNAANEAILNAFQAKLNNVYKIGEQLGYQMDGARNYYSSENSQLGSLLANAAEQRRLNNQSNSAAASDFNTGVQEQKRTVSDTEAQRIQNMLNIANTTGYNTREMQTADNPYFEDGKLKNPDGLDFSTIYKNAKASGDEQTARWAADAALAKVNNPKYQRFAEKVTALLGKDASKAAPTLDRDTMNVGRDVALAGNASNERITGIEAQNALDVIDKEKEAQIELMDKQRDLGVENLDKTELTTAIDYINAELSDLYDQDTAKKDRLILREDGTPSKVNDDIKSDVARIVAKISFLDPDKQYTLLSALGFSQEEIISYMEKMINTEKPARELNPFGI